MTAATLNAISDQVLLSTSSPLFNNVTLGLALTATAAGTTTLTAASTNQQVFTGSTTQTVVLPVTSTLALGWSFLIVNRSSGNVTVQSSGANTIQVMEANSSLLVVCIAITGTTAASWDARYNSTVGGVTSITGTSNQVVASAATGDVTLSLPQSIATTSTPTFAKAIITKVNGTEASNAVTASGGAGVITTSSLTTAGAGTYAITWTNTFITATSGIALQVVGGTNTIQDITMTCVPGSGSATLTIFNNTAATMLNGTIFISYLVY